MAAGAVMDSHVAIWCIAAAAVSGVIIRPWGLPEAVWAVAGVAVLLGAGLLPPAEIWLGVAKGRDVYLFLIGMMVLAELAREAGLFDWLAAHAAKMAHGSATRLFTLIYLVGTIVTVFLSNDATAVVLTPAVAAVAKAGDAKDPLPYLLVCAFIANAASFVLPISNPANLVIYAGHMPPLHLWLARFALPSVLSILATYAMLRITQGRALRQTFKSDVPVPRLQDGATMTAFGILAAALVLMAASALGWQLGLPTCLAGLSTAACVLIRRRSSPWPIVRGISWGVLPLVAGLFVLVEALDRTGVLKLLAGVLQQGVAVSRIGAGAASGIVLALACNIMNNLPVGLIAGAGIQAAHAPADVAGAVLIGVDLGPNLSVTGSLATILWLSALRREGHSIGVGKFLKFGVLVMPPALVLALAGLELSDLAAEALGS